MLRARFAGVLGAAPGVFGAAAFGGGGMVILSPGFRGILGAVLCGSWLLESLVLPELELSASRASLRSARLVCSSAAAAASLLFLFALCVSLLSFLALNASLSAVTFARSFS